MIRGILNITCLILFLGCSDANRRDQKEIQTYTNNRYSKGFRIYHETNHSFLEIINPWQGAKDIVYRYELCLDSLKNESITEQYNRIQIPIQRVVCLSSSHLAFLDILGESSIIYGVSGLDFIYSKGLKSEIKSRAIKDVGYDQNLNYELIVNLKPDVIFCYGVGPESIGYLNKLKELGLNVIFIGDYLEDHPLGKAEWIKVFGLLTCKSDMADSIFNSIEKSYQDALSLVNQTKIKPTVFLNTPYRDVWYFPGASSYFIKLIKDAGGDYVFNNLEGSRTYPISFEKALIASSNADLWLNPGAVNSINDIINIDERLGGVKPLINGKVFNNNKRLSEGGGNDFWESGVVRPDLILKDLIHILHPEKLPNHELFYYTKLK